MSSEAQGYECARVEVGLRSWATNFNLNPPSHFQTGLLTLTVKKPKGVFKGESNLQSKLP